MTLEKAKKNISTGRRNFGDGVIGAQAIENRLPLITSDRNFANVLQSFGGMFDYLDHKAVKEYESNFNDKNIDTVKLNKENVVIITAQCKEPYLFCDVSILAFEDEKNFNEFARIESRPSNNHKVKFCLKLHYVVGNKDNPFLAILGLYKIVFVSHKKRSVFEAVQLNRKRYEDRGFYFFKVLFLEEDFLFIYESGTCRITDAGVVLWHINLMWDDIYLNSDEGYIYYSSEFGDPVNWSLSTKTGEKNFPKSTK